MAGIGFELRKIYGRKTLASSIGGSIYATMTAVGPSVIVAVLILFLKFAMDRADITELENRFFMSSFTYIFLIAVLIAALEFYRTHRSFLVNFEYIRKYDAATVYLEKGRALMANNIIRGL